MKKTIILITLIASSFICSAQATITNPRDFSEIVVDSMVIDTIQFIDSNLNEYIDFHNYFKNKLIKQGESLENSLAWSKILEIDEKQLQVIIKELAPIKIIKRDKWNKQKK